MGRFILAVAVFVVLVAASESNIVRILQLVLSTI